MSVSVLFALIDATIFKSLTDEEVDQVTAELVAEIDSDPDLKQRLTSFVSRSAEELIARKTADQALSSGGN